MLGSSRGTTAPKEVAAPRETEERERKWGVGAPAKSLIGY